MNYECGFPFYGQNVGVLVFSTITPRTPGDAGNAATFKFPVRYEIVQGGFADLIQGSEQIKEALLSACENLKNVGIKAIVGDCGLMSLYQADMAARTHLPVVASSLCQIPFIWEVIGRTGTIGIVTGHSDLLSEAHLKNSGWREDINIKIKGLQQEQHFREIVIEGGTHLDVQVMREDVMHAIEELIYSGKNIKAIVLECSNIATFSKDIAQRYHVPVFDIVSAAAILEYSINPTDYLK